MFWLPDESQLRNPRHLQALLAACRQRGVEIGEVFHDGGGVYAGSDEPYLFGRLRVNGRDPQRRSYFSFASFSDPDGNGLSLTQG